MLSGSLQWQAIRMAWARLVNPRPVIATISDDGLVCCWKDARYWCSPRRWLTELAVMVFLSAGGDR